MIAMQFVGTAGAGALRRVELPSPAAKAGEIVIRVTAAGVNFADIMMRMGLYPEAPRRPFVPGYEVAGVVAAVGPGVEGFRAGERVMAACRFGGYSTEIAVPAEQARKIPRHLDDAEAASILVAFITAWVSLLEMARMRAGDRVLVIGAAGGVGTAAVQLARLRGASVTGLVGSAGKRGPVLALGAHEVHTYEDMERRPSTAAFDVVLEPRGGAAARASYRRLAPGGRIVFTGISSMVSGPRRSIPRVLLALASGPRLSAVRLQMDNRGLFGLNLLAFFGSEDGRQILGRAMDGILDDFRGKRLAAVLGRTFPLAEAAAALEYLRGRTSIGKVVLTVP